jgi:hypothetical protein
MTPEHSKLAADSIAHYAQMACEAVRQAATAYEYPSVIFRPSLKIDGNLWCALYGNNLQDGVAGFGESPALAMSDFDRNWFAKLKEKNT